MNYGPLEFAAHLRRRTQNDSSTVRAAREAAAVPREQENRLTIFSGPRELRPMAPGAGAPRVDVFEALATNTSTDTYKPLHVAVSSNLRPVVLVLSAHLPLCWHIDVASGAQLQAVLLAGSGDMQVQGTGEALVTSIGGYYAFRPGSDAYRHLEQEVLRTTGATIERFQGASATGSCAFSTD